MVCMDTNIVIDFLKGKTTVTNKISSLEKEGYEFTISPITVYEVLFGSRFYNPKEISQVELFFDSLTILDFNYECANVASVIHSASMQAGRDIGVMDSLFAATAWIHDEQMLTNDNHFNVINLLGVEIRDEKFNLELISMT